MPPSGGGKPQKKESHVCFKVLLFQLTIFSKSFCWKWEQKRAETPADRCKSNGEGFWWVGEGWCGRGLRRGALYLSMAPGTDSRQGCVRIPINSSSCALPSHRSRPRRRPGRKESSISLSFSFSLSFWRLGVTGGHAGLSSPCCCIKSR